MVPDGFDHRDEDSAPARIEILKRELATSRTLRVRAREGLESARLQGSQLREELAAQHDLSEALAAENAAREAALLAAEERQRESDAQNAELDAQIAERAAALLELQAHVARQETDIAALEAAIAALRSSMSWRITRPIRAVTHRLRNLIKAARNLSLRKLRNGLRARRNYAAVQRSGLFDADGYRRANPDIHEAGLDPLRHYLVLGWREGRRPGPAFDPDYYNYANPDLAKAGLNPLFHYVVYGRREGRDMRAEGEWFPPATGSGSPRETAPILPPPELDPAGPPRIAVMVHSFYPDVFAMLCPKLAKLPGRFTLLVSTPSAETKRAVEATIAAHGLNAAVDVRVTPNRGRNFAPMLSEFSQIILGHDLLLHLHTKKSLHNAGGEQAAWRDDIFAGLIGDDGVADSVIGLFMQRPEVGVIFTRTFRHMAYWANHWLQNTAQGRSLFARLGVGEYNLRGYIDYPVGGMFWARVQAIAPLFQAGLTYSDFPEEAGQLDGTIAHAIERSFVDIARSRGYIFAEADPDENLYRLGWSDKNLERYELNSPSRLAAQIARADLISFDLFDTVLLRPSLSPDAVQRYAGLLLEREMPGGADFFSARKAAETAARAAQGYEGDVGLDVIYQQMRDAGWDAARLARARVLEIEIECRLVLTRQPVVSALRAAKAAGKRVIAVSDTYFDPSEINALLTAAGIDGLFDEIVLSSQSNARKDRGDLWTLLKAREGQRAYWLHIGDNEVSDMQRAGDLGLAVFHTMNPVTLLLQKGVFSASTVQAVEEEKSWADALLLGPAAARLGADPFPAGGALGPAQITTAHDLGYCVYGPALFAFCAWLVAQPSLRALDRVYFLSREGWALQPIYDALRAGLDEGALPPSRYLHISRRAVMLASQTRQFNPETVIDGPEFKGNLAGLLMARLGFEIPADAGLDGAASIQLPGDAAVVRDALEQLKDQIQAQAATEAPALAAYLAQQGLDAKSSVGVVDIGYRATIQKGLQTALGRGLAGFYQATFPEAAETAMPQADGSTGSAVGYFGDSIDPLGEAPIVRHAILIEAFLTAPEGQLDHFDVNAAGTAEPVFQPGRRTAEEIAVLAQLHAGALAYANDLISWYGPSLLDLTFDPAAALAPLQAFARGRITAPKAVLGTLRVDDAFCGYEEHEVGLDLAALASA